jgi:hypothetical protein
VPEIGIIFATLFWHNSGTVIALLLNLGFASPFHNSYGNVFSVGYTIVINTISIG